MKAELLIKERWWVDKLDCVNKNIPGQTTKGIKQYKKQYYIDNSEKIKQYQIDNSEKIKQYQKQYKIDNPEKIKQQQKQYNIDRSYKIKCVCGSHIRKRGLTEHKKTKKHIKYMDLN
jgi:hypothetical protein